MNDGKKIVNIAIVEDEKSAMDRLCEVLDRYGNEKGVLFNKRLFGLSTDFLEKYNATYDIVFMDIQLPDMDGMTAAKKLRETDKTVMLVFVTNMSQYAINGYEVDAADFIVKPLEYKHFAMKMEHIFRYISSLSDITLPVKTANGMVSVAASKLMYVEVMGHELIFHTTHGDYRTYGSLSKLSQRLSAAHFVRCNNYYLVNPRYVESIGTDTTIVGGVELKMSYARRKEYRKAVAAYLGGFV